MMKNFYQRFLTLFVIIISLGISHAWGGTKRIYAEYSAVSSWWGNDGRTAIPYIYAWGGGHDAKKYTMTATGTSNLAYCDIDDYHTDLLFFRSTSETGSWDNQTVDVSIGSNNRWSILDSQDGSGHKNINNAQRWVPGVSIDGLIDVNNPHTQAFTFDGNVGTYTVTLSAHSTYQFCVRDGSTRYTLDNHVWTSNISNYTLNTSGYDIRLTTAGAGTYTFTYNKSTHVISVAYPTVSHPNIDYCYMIGYNDWTHKYLHVWNSASSIAGTTYPGTEMFNYFEIDGTKYYYFAPGDYAKCQPNDNYQYRQTDDMNTSDGHGKFISYINGWGWRDFTVRIQLENLGATSVGTEYQDIAFNSGVLSDITCPDKTNYTFGGYFTEAEGAGTQLINADGHWIASVADYTDASKHWIHAGTSTTLYAKWMETTYMVTVAAGANGSVSPASVSGVGYVTASGDITATANTGYHFVNWTLPSGVTAADNYSASSNPIHIHATTNGTTITANFTANGYTVQLENQGATSAGTESVSVTYNANTNLTTSISCPTKTHYTFGGYFTEAEGAGTQLINADGSWIASVSGYTDASKNWKYTNNITLYAKWTENTYTVNVAVSPAGMGSVQVNSATVSQVTAGFATHSPIMTAVPVNAAWCFKEWQVTSDAHLDLEHYSSTGTTMEITATAANQTITAVFQKRYTLVGSIYNSAENGGMPGMTNYDAEFTINSTSPSYDLSRAQTLLANTTYQVEVHDRATNTNLGRSGCATGCVLGEGVSLVMENQDNVVFLNTVGAGEYLFKITNIDASGHPTLTVLRPQQVNFGWKYINIGGSLTSGNVGGTVAVTKQSDGSAVSNGAWLPYGTAVTYTATPTSGYKVDWYGNSEYSGEPFSSSYSFNHAGTTMGNGYAKFTELATSVTLSNDSHGKIQIDGTDATSTTCGVTTTRSLTAVPNTGYSFNGWTKVSGADCSISSTSDNPTTLRGLGSGLSTGQEIRANFSAKTYTVTLDNDHGNPANNGTATATYASSTLTNKTDATFSGWNLLGYWNNTAVQVINSNGTLIAGVSGYTDGSGNWIYDGNVSLYAHWSRNITLNANGGNTNGTVTVTYKDMAATPSAPSRTGYSVEGYYAESGCTTKVMNPNGSLVASVSGYTDASNHWIHQTATTLYTKWTANTYTVTLHNDHDGAASDDGSATATYDATSLTVSKDAQFSGWTLLGYWNSSAVQVANANGTLIANVSGYTNASAHWTKTGDADLWAHWSRSITLDRESGTTGAESMTVTYKGTSLDGYTAPTRTGYTFDGYWSGAGGTGTQIINTSGTLQSSVSGYTDGSGQWIKQDATTLYAKWTADTYTVNLDRNSGTSGATSVTMTYNSSTMIGYTSPTRTFYSFGGYYTSETGNNGNGALVIDSDGVLQANVEGYTGAGGIWIRTTPTTLYAKWLDIFYRIAFQHNGHGTIAVNGDIVESGGTAMVYHLFTRSLVATPNAGYHFTGWAVSGEDANKVVIGNTSATSTTIKSTGGNATVTAGFEPDVYIITYKDQDNAAFSGVHGDGYPTSHTYGTATALVSPTKVGYTFGGWFTTSACTGDAVTSLGATAYTDNITLYAKWTVNNYTISLDDQEPTTSASVSTIGVTYNANTNLTGTVVTTRPTKTGYLFDGYYTETNGNGVQIIDKDGVVNASVSGYTDESKNWKYAGSPTLYAKWIAITVSVTISPTRINSNTATNVTFTITTNAPNGYTYAIRNFGTTEPNPGYFDGDHYIGNGLEHMISVNLATGIWKTAIVIIYPGHGEQVTSDVITLTVATEYTLAYNGNDNTGGTIPSGGGTYLETETPAVASNSGNLTKTGFTFAGWNTASDGSGTDYTAGSGTVTMNGNITLYAKWTAAITLNANGGTANGSATATYKSGSASVDLVPTHTTKQVSGYYDATEGGNLVMDADGTLHAGVSGYTDANGKWTGNNTTLYAHWASRPWYWIYGEGAEVSSGTTFASVSDEIFTLKLTTSNGQKFHVGNGVKPYGPNAWIDCNTSSANLALYEMPPTYAFTYTGPTQPVIYTLDTENMTLSLSSPTYDIVLDNNSPTTSGSTSVTLTYNSDSHATINNPSKTYYTFDGWYSGAGGTGNMIINPSGTLQANTSYTNGSGQWTNDGVVTLYAKWSQNVFNGTVDSDWDKPGNWSYGHEPTNEESVVIDAACEISSTGNQCKDMVFNSGSLTITTAGMLKVNGTLTNTNAAKLTVNIPGGIAIGSGMGSVHATVNFHSKSGKYNGKYRWQAFGWPLQDQTDVHGPFGQSWIMYYQGYDEWDYINNGDHLTPFQGYLTTHKGNAETGKDFTFAGTLNGDATKELSLNYYPTDATHQTSDHWNLVANSWLAPIDVATLTSGAFSNADATIYLLNTGSRAEQGDTPGSINYGETGYDAAGQYSAVNSTLASSQHVLIAPGQGFFVEATSSSSPTLTLNYAEHVFATAASTTRGSNVMRAPRREQATALDFTHMKIAVRGDRFGDEMHIFEGDRFTTEYDNGADGRKAMGMFETSPQIMAQAEYGDMSLYATPDADGTLIGFRAGTADTQYTLRFSGNMGQMYLTDLVTNTETLVGDGSEYTFTAENTDEVMTRFRLNRSTQHGGTTTDIEDGTAGVKVLVRDGEVELVWNNEQGAKNKDIRLYDATGKLLYEEQGTRNKEQGASGVTLRFTLPQQGVYLLRIGTTTRKIVW